MKTFFIKTIIENRIKISSLVLVLLASGFFSSCSKFLDEELQGDYPVSQFMKTESDVNLAVTSVYNILSYANTDNRNWVFATIASDDATKGGITGDQADIQLINDFNIDSDNGNLEMLWALYYEGITRANFVIDGAPDVEMDETLKNQYIAECKFLRAYYYFWLSNIYGDVPLLLEPKNADELQIPATVRDEILQTAIIDVLKDITENEYLPVTYASSDIGRATQGAALGLLAKAYLFMEEWDNAATTARAIINLGVYSLSDIYSQNFNALYSNNSESVFTVQHLSGQSPALGNSLNQWFAPRANNGYGFNVPEQVFVDAFETTSEGIADPRLLYTVGMEGYIWTDDQMFDPDWSPTGYMQRKFIQPLSEIPKELKSDADIDYTFMRYSEVYLILAEALNETGQTSESLIYLNKVRERARNSFIYDETLEHYGSVPEGMLPDIVTANQTTLRDAIRHERRVELGFEMHRYFDIIRYGSTYANNVFAGTAFNYETNKYFPYPQSELDTNHELK